MYGGSSASGNVTTVDVYACDAGSDRTGEDNDQQKVGDTSWRMINPSPPSADARRPSFSQIMHGNCLFSSIHHGDPQTRKGRGCVCVCVPGLVWWQLARAKSAGPAMRSGPTTNMKSSLPTGRSALYGLDESVSPWVRARQFTEQSRLPARGRCKLQMCQYCLVCVLRMHSGWSLYS